MPRLRRINIERSEALNQQLAEFVERLKKDLPVQEVYLYGSFARGHFHEGSDIDLVIVGDFEGKVFDRIGKVLDLTDLPIEPLVYTPQEFAQMVAERNSFIEEVLRSGRKL